MRAARNRGCGDRDCESNALDFYRVRGHQPQGELVLRDGQLVGIISERDYARKVVLQGRASSTTPVRDIMSSPVVTASPGDTVDHAMRLMTDRRIRHLAVVSGEQVVGVVSIGDLKPGEVKHVDRKSTRLNSSHT